MVIGGLATMALPLGQAERTGFSPEGIQFFESKIRPLLVNNCHECHGNEKHKGNLQLTPAKPSCGAATLARQSCPATRPRAC